MNRPRYVTAGVLGALAAAVFLAGACQQKRTIASDAGTLPYIPLVRYSIPDMSQIGRNTACRVVQRSDVVERAFDLIIDRAGTTASVVAYSFSPGSEYGVEKEKWTIDFAEAQSKLKELAESATYGDAHKISTGGMLSVEIQNEGKYAYFYCSGQPEPWMDSLFYWFLALQAKHDGMSTTHDYLKTHAGGTQ